MTNNRALGPRPQVTGELFEPDVVSVFGEAGAGATPGLEFCWEVWRPLLEAIDAVHPIVYYEGPLRWVKVRCGACRNPDDPQRSPWVTDPLDRCPTIAATRPFRPSTRIDTRADLVFASRNQSLLVDQVTLCSPDGSRPGAVV